MKKTVELFVEDLESRIKERLEDKHFSDSWEQSVNIGKEIEKMEKYRDTLDAFKNGEEYDRKILMSALRERISGKTIKYRMKGKRRNGF